MFEGQKFDIEVRTNRPRTNLKGYDKDKQAYLLDVAAPPEKGKANIEIVRFISKMTKKRASIIKGKKSRRKTVRLL